LITKQTKIELQNYPAGIYYILVFLSLIVELQKQVFIKS